MPGARRSVGYARRAAPATLTVLNEAFTGTNGSSFGANWTNPRTTTGAVISIQSNQGSVTSGTLTGYTGKGGIQTVASVSDFVLRADYTVGAAGEYYPMIGFRSSTTWSTTHASALNSYWFEIKRAENTFHLYKRVGDTPTLLSTTAYTFTAGDVLHIVISAVGTAVKVRVYKNAETEVPTAWQVDLPTLLTDFSSGVVYLAINGGNDGVTDTALFDNVIITTPSSTVTGTAAKTLSNATLAAAGSGGTAGATMRVGATWTQTRPTSGSDSILAASDVQAQHIIDFGAGSNLCINSGALASPDFSGLDPFVQDMTDAGATTPMIVFCRAPGWMKSSGVTSDDFAVVPARVNDWATLCAKVAARYTGVSRFVVWNEMKGYYVPPIGDPSRAAWEAIWGTSALSNTWDYIHYTQMYNAVYAAVKAVRPSALVGGPYVPMDSGSSAGVMSNPSSLTFTGGVIDQRALDTYTYWKNNATGFDFVCCDGGMGNKFGTATPNAPASMISKFWKTWQWVRSNVHASVPLYWMETYIQEALDPPWNLTLAQTEDLYIQMCREIQQNVSNPTGAMLTWMHPTFRPQLVARVDANSWNNGVASGLKAKTDTWHSTGS